MGELVSRNDIESALRGHDADYIEVRLDDSKPAAGLTNLQVEVEIEP